MITAGNCVLFIGMYSYWQLHVAACSLGWLHYYPIFCCLTWCRLEAGVTVFVCLAEAVL